MTTTPVPATATVTRESSRAWGYLRSNPSFWIGAVGVGLIIGAAVFAPLIAPHDPNFQFRGEGLTRAGDPLGPSAKFPLGTDKLGRDELSRLLYGARTSLTVGILANAMADLHRRRGRDGRRLLPRAAHAPVGRAAAARPCPSRSRRS